MFRTGRQRSLPYPLALYVSPGFLAGSCQLWAPGRSYTKTLAGFLALTKGALQGTWLIGIELSDVLFIAVEDGSDESLFGVQPAGNRLTPARMGNVGVDVGYEPVFVWLHLPEGAGFFGEQFDLGDGLGILVALFPGG